MIFNALRTELLKALKFYTIIVARFIRMNIANKINRFERN
jgi:hypothetical protein